MFTFDSTAHLASIPYNEQKNKNDQYPTINHWSRCDLSSDPIHRYSDFQTVVTLVPGLKYLHQPAIEWPMHIWPHNAAQFGMKRWLPGPNDSPVSGSAAFAVENEQGRVEDIFNAFMYTRADLHCSNCKDKECLHFSWTGPSWNTEGYPNDLGDDHPIVLAACLRCHILGLKCCSTEGTILWGPKRGKKVSVMEIKAHKKNDAVYRNEWFLHIAGKIGQRNGKINYFKMDPSIDRAKITSGQSYYSLGDRPNKRPRIAFEPQPEQSASGMIDEIGNTIQTIKEFMNDDLKKSIFDGEAELQRSKGRIKDLQNEVEELRKKSDQLEEITVAKLNLEEESRNLKAEVEQMKRSANQDRKPFPNYRPPTPPSSSSSHTAISCQSCTDKEKSLRDVMTELMNEKAARAREYQTYVK